MAWYIIKLLLLLPLIAGMIWGSLKLAQFMQTQFMQTQFMARGGARPADQRSVRIVETTMLSPTQKLAVLQFHDREILVSVTRHGLTRLAEAPGRALFEAQFK